jgi:NAD(P)-dependent dehydrogenase (short-subunit alcohol dehydrogenase family)
VTLASSELARAILSLGQKCVASSREPSKTPEAVAEIEKLGRIWIPLDVAGSDIEADMAACIDVHGPIDVLINNAGYADGGVIKKFR